jgi:hypothetical protein
VELVFRWVQTIFKAAISDRVIPASPCGAIKLPNVDVVEVVPMAPETVEALADTIAAPVPGPDHLGSRHWPSDQRSSRVDKQPCGLDTSVSQN